MDAANYFDNAATTPLDREVLDAMLPYLREDFGNANSIHTWGRKAREAVELARGQVANLVGCAPEELFFTSGATESNNWILRQFRAEKTGVSPFEHSSIRELAEARGCHFLKNDGWIVSAPPDLDVVSVMTVNNETGAILAAPPGYGREWTDKFQAPKLHRDATQQLGKFSVSLASTDYLSASAHKLYGPKGVGVLYVRDAEPLTPLMDGGEHEQGMRAGTLNVPGIVGFGMACEIAAQRMATDLAQAEKVNNIVLEELAGLSDWQQNRSKTNSPYILSLSFFGVEGETLVIEADTAGFAISSGAACSSGSTEPSHVLTALGLDPEWMRGTVRVSFGRENSADSAQNLAKVLKGSVKMLREMGKRPD